MYEEKYSVHKIYSGLFILKYDFFLHKIEMCTKYSIKNYNYDFVN